MSQNNKWTISFDYSGNYFNYNKFFDTKELAIKAFSEDLKSGGWEEVKKRGYFWVGQYQEHSVSKFFNAENVIDNAWEIAQNEGGEFAEDYLQDVTQKQKDELQKLLVSWAEKHNLQPNFYSIINSEKVII